jgi:hypothetical protein
MEFGTGDFYRFVLCLRAVKSNNVRIIHLDGAEQDRKNIIKKFFPQRAMVGENFPKFEDERWKLSRYRIIDVVKRRPSKNWTPISKNPTCVNRVLGRILGIIPWHKLKKIKGGGDIGISKKRHVVGV